MGSPLLLGPEGEQIRFRTRKHFALLIRLVVEPGKRFSRESLADLLWPDAPQRLAAHSLAQAVSVLKERLGREPVLVRRATVGLAEGVVDADVHHLDACDAEIGGHFLDGFEIPAARGFEEWKDEWRAKLTPRLRDCLVRQMDAGRRIGDFAHVERHAQVLAELDSLSEDAVRGIMEARAWVGDRTTALKVYARHEERLAQELGAKPSADLTRMAGLLREGRSRATAYSAAAPPAPPSGSGAVAEPGPPPRAEKRFESETLVGRGKEFAALYDNWLEVRRRAPRIVVLAGDPGVGKTTLTNAFVSSCQMEGAVVARAQAYDAERELPYAVLGELVRQLTVQRAIGGAEPEALSELSRVTPEIFAVFPGVPKPVEWSAEVTPLRLADAFLKTVTAAAEESPLVLVVDDVHAVDNASAAILHIVARKLTGTRALVILAGRPTELRISGTPAALTSDATIEGLRHLDLEPLSPEAAADLAMRLAARRPRSDRVREPAALVDASLPTERLLRASGGNPLAIELLTREWVEHGRESLLRDLEALDTLPAATLGIPRAIQTVFERQVQRLDSRTRAVLDLAAVLGRRLTDLALYAAVDCPPGQAAEALSRLLDAHFLREVQGDLEFRNELIRAQAYYGVAGKVRQQLHRRVAEVLVARHASDGQPLHLEIAWHYLRGADPARALAFAVDGAEAAVVAGAPREAEQLASAMLHEQIPASSERQLRLLLGRALMHQSKAGEALPGLEALAASGSLSPRELAEVTRLIAEAEYLLNRANDVRHRLAAERALEAARACGDEEAHVRALFECARVGVESGTPDDVFPVKDRVEQLVAEARGPCLPLAYLTAAYCESFLLEYEQAKGHLQQAIRLFGGSSNVRETIYAYSGLGVVHLILCELPASRKALMTALELAKRVGDDSRVSTVAANLCAVRTLQGDYQDAIRLGRMSLDWGHRSLSQPFLVIAYTNLADAYILTGRREKALECMEGARRWVEQDRSWRANVAFLMESAALALETGNLSLALNLVEKGERLVQGRERSVPNQGLFLQLRALWLLHQQGPGPAMAFVETAATSFRTTAPLHYLSAVAAKAWIEKTTNGTYSEKSCQDLQLFDRMELPGLRALLVAQNFID